MPTTEQLTIDIAAVQDELQAKRLGGWLFYNFRGSDPLALSILHLDPRAHSTRRWFYFIPAEGKPLKLVHRIEMSALDRLDGEKLVYLGWRELAEQLKLILPAGQKIAMQYSPNNAVPYVSRVDAGTVELVESSGVTVVSSADLVQRFESRLTADQLRTHVKAVENLRAIVFEAFAKIAQCIKSDQAVNEYDIQQFIWARCQHYGMTSDSPCIVAVNEHSGSPHYQPTAGNHAPIKKGDFVLIDLWAKLQQPADAVYGDITWTGFVGDSVPEKYKKVFDIVAGARDAAVACVRSSVEGGGPLLKGLQVDDVTRNYITERGYGAQFIHRTGHSIGTQVHGNGANIDNLETEDGRSLLADTCFSIEPGVYLAEFGVRSEIDVYITTNKVIVAGQPIQTEVVPILR